MIVTVKARQLLVSIVVASVFVLPAYGQHHSPSKDTNTNVVDILKSPVDGREVEMQGHLLRQAAFDRYVFSDGTGEIVAKIKSSRFPGLSFDAATDIKLVGKINTVPNQPPEIDAKSVQAAE